jgi:hypothetical protein
MGSVPSPDPRQMTVAQLEALGCERSPAKALRRLRHELDCGPLIDRAAANIAARVDGAGEQDYSLTSSG